MNICRTIYIAFFVLSACVGTSDSNDGPAYVVESIDLPEGLTAEVAAMDVMDDGRLVVAFMRGEIMIYEPDSRKWSLFASGLHEPLGLLVVDQSEILVMQLPELTRLNDTDGDGMADHYETVYDGFGMTGNYHEFAYGPVQDSQGNLYVALNASSSGGGISSEVRGDINMMGKGKEKAMFSVVPYRGWVMKISNDGKVIPFASGFRSPNGLVIDEKDRLFVTDNQGDWVGSSPLYHVCEGQFYGHPASLVWTENWLGGNPFNLDVEMLDRMRDKPAVIFPHDVIANSPTQPLRIEDDRFGPFEGQYIVGEMNKERLVRIMLEEINGVVQGAVTPFIDGHGLRKGNNRLAIAHDGSLWVGQSDHGWLGDRGIQRITFTGNVPFDLQHVRLVHNGFELDFTQPISFEKVPDIRSLFMVKKYRYQYHSKYGSPQTDLENVEIMRAEVSDGGRTVKMRLGKVDPGFIYEISVESIYNQQLTDSLMNKKVAYTVKTIH